MNIEKHVVQILDPTSGKVTLRTVNPTIKQLGPTALVAAQQWAADREAMLNSTLKTNAFLTKLTHGKQENEA